MPHRRPPRLPITCYRGAARVFLTFCTFDRRPLFISERIVSLIRGELLRTSALCYVVVAAYCFMPDHLHVLAEGSCPDADIAVFASRFKQASGYVYRRRRHDTQHLWQEGYYDRVLREEDDALKVARYVIGNPVRAGLCADVREYPYIGSERYSIEELVDSLA